jgi:GNAT superfamily N-acetyltransferase
LADHDLLVVRTLVPTGYPRVLAVIDEWWGGRPMSARLSRVFFEHFSSTSYAVDRGDEPVAFFIGLMSQTVADEAYVHFAGVHPDHRGRGLASRLYTRFFEVVSGQGRSVVRSSTSPCNELSIAFHLAMGFALEGGNGVVNGWPARVDYPLPGESRVFFVKRLRPALAELSETRRLPPEQFTEVWRLQSAS